MSTASGCSHYRRHCHVRAECCQQWVACRLCHNEQFTDHEIDRHAIRAMRCDACLTEQPCARTCSKCEAIMGAYFCQVCNLFDDAGDEKKVFHCDGCGICRAASDLPLCGCIFGSVGGRENFFHCGKCCGCYPHSLQNKHKCLEGSMHRECAICLEVTFASLESVHVLPCGHVLHGGCWEEYISHGHYRCPSCRTKMFWSEDGDAGANDDDDDDEEEDTDQEGEQFGEQLEDGESSDEMGESDESDEAANDLNGELLEFMEEVIAEIGESGSETNEASASTATMTIEERRARVLRATTTNPIIQRFLNLSTPQSGAEDNSNENENDDHSSGAGNGRGDGAASTE